MPPNGHLPINPFITQHQSNGKLHETKTDSPVADNTNANQPQPQPESKEPPKMTRHQFKNLLKNLSPTKVADHSAKQSDANQNVQSTLNVKHYNANDNWSDILSDINGAASIVDMKIDETDKQRNIDDCTIDERFYDNSLNGNNDRSISSINEICNEMDKIAILQNDEMNAIKIELKHVWTELKIGSKYDCVLSDINCPSKFWLQLKEYRPKLVTLVNDMTYV